MSMWKTIKTGFKVWIFILLFGLGIALVSLLGGWLFSITSSGIALALTIVFIIGYWFLLGWAYIKYKGWLGK